MILNETQLSRQGFLAIIVFRPLDGLEQECLEAIRLLYQLIRSKSYGRGILLRDVNDGAWIGIRFWASEEARREAQEDPELLRVWQRLGHLCTVELVREQLEKIDLD
jgi:hypothetical protein